MVVTAPYARKAAYASLASLAITALPLASHAIDFVTPDASRVVSDPTYLPLQGQVYGSTGFSYDRTTGNVSNSAGVQRYSYESKGTSVNQTLEYGVTDDFTLRATDSYTPWHKNDQDLASGATRNSDTDGFTDPAFGATWRVIDQKQSPFSLDLTGSYSPDMIDSKSASPNNDGTVARGGDAGTGQIAVSHKTKDFTIQGYGGATYLGTRDTFNQTNGSTSSSDSSWQYFAGIATQTRFTDLVSLNLGAEYVIPHNVNVSNSTTAAGYTSNPSNSTDFTAALNYHIIPNRLVAGLTYQYNWYNTNSDNVYANPLSNTTTKNDGENIFGARLQYVFF